MFVGNSANVSGEGTQTVDDMNLLYFIGGIVTIVVGLIAILRFGVNIGSWKNTLDTLAKTVKEIQAEQKDFRKEVTEKFAQLGERVRSVETSIDHLRSPTPGTTNNSPRTLSKLGKKISNEIRAKDVVESIAPEWAKRTKGMERFDVQELCYEYVYKELETNPQLERRMKESAFVNGVDMRTIREVLSIELRDRLLNAKNKKTG